MRIEKLGMVNARCFDKLELELGSLYLCDGEKCGRQKVR